MSLSPDMRCLCRLGKHQGYSLGMCCIILLVPRKQEYLTERQLFLPKASPS
ncbi:hypothetical protein DPMN_013327 [Dreissena polymorpha]|uniref:Uncharacterized protein n=1 Tax=Dreissena polymorpha TaxID=45954 RepID=A0A9D4S1S2_DREPO|nr:hypothetical protein DPMN_013327 [Dreissena polymorpha]